MKQAKTENFLDFEGIKKRNCGIISLKERKYSAWIGGSGIASLSNFSNKWISRNNYFDYGEKLFECDYLFNYSGLGDGQSKKINNGEIGSAEIYKKMVMSEQI